MPQSRLSGSFSSPKVDVAIDMGNPFLNLTVDGFLKIGSVAVGKVAVEETYKCLSKGTVIRRAEMYQEYMKQIRVPTHHGSAIPFTTWQGLAKSLKQLYGQPLHYLTNVILKQWDQSRISSENEHLPLDAIIHPRTAEATIWLMEQVHRLTPSHHHLANLWISDPMHHAFVDPIFPQI